ncbi:MAG: hypothetical protein CVV25_06740 [Ignavibacteriae bacterium HGW-Ignavibacteriae-4]|jgi:excisionase family DNA binding protein|nr:MAG: hypothetical protein CVV25_06740 [Ignavibacteriae bacterium HGW-Ignavibacteriae-4]
MENTSTNKYSKSELFNEIVLAIENAMKNESSKFKTDNSNNHNPVLYTIKEVLVLLKISKPTLYSLFKSNKLKPSKIGRRSFIHHKELDRYLEQLNS